MYHRLGGEEVAKTILYQSTADGSPIADIPLDELRYAIQEYVYGKRYLPEGANGACATGPGGGVGANGAALDPDYDPFSDYGTEFVNQIIAEEEEQLPEEDIDEEEVEEVNRQPLETGQYDIDLANVLAQQLNYNHAGNLDNTGKMLSQMNVNGQAVNGVNGVNGVSPGGALFGGAGDCSLAPVSAMVSGGGGGVVGAVGGWTLAYHHHQQQQAVAFIQQSQQVQVGSPRPANQLIGDNSPGQSIRPICGAKDTQGHTASPGAGAKRGLMRGGTPNQTPHRQESYIIIPASATPAIAGTATAPGVVAAGAGGGLRLPTVRRPQMTLHQAAAAAAQHHHQQQHMMAAMSIGLQQPPAHVTPAASGTNNMSAGSNSGSSLSPAEQVRQQRFEELSRMRALLAREHRQSLTDLARWYGPRFAAARELSTNVTGAATGNGAIQLAGGGSGANGGSAGVKCGGSATREDRELAATLVDHGRVQALVSKLERFRALPSGVHSAMDGWLEDLSLEENR